MQYPNELTSDHLETLNVDDQAVDIRGVNLAFKPWTGPKLQSTFGGKPIVEYRGKPMFAELAIVNKIIEAGWSARWVARSGSIDNGLHYLVDWLDVPFKHQTRRPLDNIKHQEVIPILAAGMF